MTLLSAFAQLLKARKNVFLIFVGGGELREQLSQEADRLGIFGHIRFSEGFVSPQEIPNYMQAFDFLCVSSVGEGWPNVIFEAMICNKPVIATSVGGIPEAICSRDYGLLVPPGDPAAMSNAMEKALDIHWCGEKIAQYAKDNSWTKVGAKYNQIYRQLWFAHGQARK
jgi:glycosyltransferase involved in cell wall biosynthesis